MSKAKTKKIEIRQGDKCAFVRSLPRNLSAAEVQEKAEKRGMTLSAAYIHNIRSAAGKKSREILKSSKTSVVKGTRKQQEKLFQQLVVTLGPARAGKLLEQATVALLTNA